MQFRTDLALEQTASLEGGLPDGVTTSTKQSGNIQIHTVEITTSQAAHLVGKPEGRYITLELAPLSGSAKHSDEEIQAAADEILPLLPKEGLVLVVGLGNCHITPDALGPQVIHQILATRHISGEVAASAGLEHLRPVCAIAPGVLGQTGMETSEITRSLVKEVKPAALIVVDALAARETARLGATVQIANTGISPGSGVFNKRSELSEATLGVPVISMGIPTVVDASTLAFDLLSSPTTQQQEELFAPRGSQMMVTPREIDLLIERGARFVSLAINRALQPTVSIEDLTYLLN